MINQIKPTQKTPEEKQNMPKTMQEKKFQVWVGVKDETSTYSGMYNEKIINMHSISKLSLLASAINLIDRAQSYLKESQI